MRDVHLLHFGVVFPHIRALGAVVGDEAAHGAIDEEGGLGTVDHAAGALVQAEHRQGIAGAAFIARQEFRIEEGGEHGIGRLGIVLNVELTTHGVDGGGHHLVQALVQRVDEVDAPIGHRATRIIPEVAEGGKGSGLDAPTVGVEGDLGRGSQPHIPIEVGGGGAVGGLP